MQLCLRAVACCRDAHLAVLVKALEYTFSQVMHAFNAVTITAATAATVTPATIPRAATDTSTVASLLLLLSLSLLLLLLLLPQPVVIDPALEALPAEDKQYLQQHAALRAVLLTMEDLHLSELSYPRQVTLMQQLHATRYVCLSSVHTAVANTECALRTRVAAAAAAHPHACALLLSRVRHSGCVLHERTTIVGSRLMLKRRTMPPLWPASLLRVRK
jgi:hypothetical protein